MKLFPAVFMCTALQAVVSLPLSFAAEEVAEAELAQVHGGLVVQVGASDAATAVSLARTGRYIVHLLGTDKRIVEQMRVELHQQNVYGIASAEQFDVNAELPYTENLVNLVIASGEKVSPKEVFRVLVPNGVVVATETSSLTKAQLEAAGFQAVKETESPGDAKQSWLVARKPWPESFDRWSHSRHDSNGNAVSFDTASGPPERIRWIAAHSGHEVEGLVSDGGRNFYGRTLTRDSFNGLRLWHRDLSVSEDHADPAQFVMKSLPRDQARPVATEKYLFAVAFPTQNLVALDAVTGEIVRSFPEIAKPKELVQHNGTVVATTDEAIYAFDAASSKQLWKMDSKSPRTVVAGQDQVNFIQGRPTRGEKSEAVSVDLYSGKVLWTCSGYPWLDKVSRTVLFNDQLAFEVSSFNDFDKDCGIYILSAKSGVFAWEKMYPPGMNHARQARAMFIGDDLWIQHGGKADYPDRESLETTMKRLPIKVSALDPKTGDTRRTLDGGLSHCAPPVATTNFMLSGVVEMTDLRSGDVVVNSITKAYCSRENSWIPANGLVYATPKHCSCWPMLRGYVGLAPQYPGKDAASYPPDLPVEQIQFVLEKGSGTADSKAPAADVADWPMYRNDAWRSSSSLAAGPDQLDTLWSTNVSVPKNGLPASSPIGFDWKENPFVKGLVTAPVIAGGRAYVARPDVHEVVALNAGSGKVEWRFTANGRVDTPPTIYRGLCLFGDHSGYVYALEGDTGELVWRLTAAPMNERMVAYGQVESPWPVPGSILILDDIAYFMAGRQSLSDGGIFFFAVNPINGERHWVKKLDSIPQKGFYENSGLEFDPIDILHREGDGIAMSRWIFSRDGEIVADDKWNGFAKLNTGKGAVYTPRGSWTYGPRQIHRFANEAFRRPLCVYRDNTLIGALNSTTTLYRRDFEEGERFNSKWITGWQAATEARQGLRPYRSDRIAEKAIWKVNLWATSDAEGDQDQQTTVEGSKQLENKLYGMVMDAKDRLYVVHQDGSLKVVGTKDGKVLSEASVPAPSWDGLALAQGKLYLTTEDGRLLCLGDKETKTASR